MFPAEIEFANKAGIIVLDPLSYLEMTRLEASATAILTDSGGVQKEAFFHGVPCLTLRDETEWVETVELGWNVVCGPQTSSILENWTSVSSRRRLYDVQPYGDGRAAHHVVRQLVGSLEAGAIR